MKKYLILFNNMAPADGVFRSAVSLANLLADQPDTEVTLRPIFTFKKETKKLIDSRVIIKPKYRFYFRGFKRIFSLVPNSIINRMMIKGRYDVEIGFCVILPQRAVAFSRNKDAEHILWVHGYSYRDFYKNDIIDKIMCVSEENTEKMKKAIDNKVPVYTCLNIMDEKNIQKMAEESIDLKRDETPLFVSVARFTKEKGYERLLEVVNKLVNGDGYKFQLWLVGDGPLYNQLCDYVKQNKLEHTVIFTGSQLNPHKYTSKADCFILSSFEEGYSTSCAEAILLGVPVMTTKVGGANEIIKNAGSGLIMDNSTEGIYEGMKKVLDDHSLLSKWKEETLKNRVKFYSDVRKKAILDALNEKPHKN